MARQLGYYGLVAGLCAALNILILIWGASAKLHYVASSILSFVVCVCVGYALHCRCTFRSKPTTDGMARYTLAMSLNLPGSLLSLWIFYDLLGLSMSLAAPVTTLLLTAVNYLLSRWAILPGVQMPASPPTA